jgi:DinB superfamily
MSSCESAALGLPHHRIGRHRRTELIDDRMALADPRRIPIEASVEAVSAARKTTAEILDRLDEEQWARGGTHTESGPYGVEAWLEIYAAHAHDHADQIRRARESGLAS